jgi:predicted DNA-binding transcriptional regulator AlpA
MTAPVTPALMNASELMGVLGLKKSHFYRLRKLGKFRPFEVKMPIGSRRYSRQLVDRHVAGEFVFRIGERRTA